jgi:hypothetical protein
MQLDKCYILVLLVTTSCKECKVQENCNCTCNGSSKGVQVTGLCDRCDSFSIPCWHDQADIALTQLLDLWLCVCPAVATNATATAAVVCTHVSVTAVGRASCALLLQLNVAATARHSVVYTCSIERAVQTSVEVFCYL